MTTPAHGTMGVIITSTLTCNPIILTTILILGMWPDVRRLFQKDRNDWTLYKQLHDLKKYWWIPGWNLHIFLDLFMHDKKTGKWKWWVKYVEISFWIIFLVIYGKFLLTFIKKFLIFVS